MRESTIKDVTFQVLTTFVCDYIETDLDDPLDIEKMARIDEYNRKLLAFAQKYEYFHIKPINKYSFPIPIPTIFV